MNQLLAIVVSYDYFTISELPSEEKGKIFLLDFLVGEYSYSALQKLNLHPICTASPKSN